MVRQKCSLSSISVYVFHKVKVKVKCKDDNNNNDNHEEGEDAKDDKDDGYESDDGNDYTDNVTIDGVSALKLIVSKALLVSIVLFSYVLFILYFHIYSC